MEKILAKHYLKITFENTSPLAIGSGESELTDKDIIQNSKNEPYIPGSTLAGMYRSLFEEDEAKKYFGWVTKKEDTNETVEKADSSQIAQASPILVYNADVAIGSSERRIVSRDMVKLDEYKTAVKGAKFDFQVLEPGVTFVSYVEWNQTEPIKEETTEYSIQWLGPLKKIADAWYQGEISLGGKTGRGYGQLKIKSVQYRGFQIVDDEDVFLKSGQKEKTQGVKLEGIDTKDQWLEFDMYAQEDGANPSDGQSEDDHQKASKKQQSDDTKKSSSWKIYEGEKSGIANKTTITLKLKQVGGIAIRRYSAIKDADYEQLTIRRGDQEIPVIPGTSWAGAFRAQMKKLNQDLDQTLYFGEKKSSKKELKKKDTTEKDYKDRLKSRVMFGESQIEGARAVQVTRNAIDRFTNATVSGALYTERTWYGGKTELVITVDEARIGKDEDSKENLKAFYVTLAAAIADLHEGYMAVGGLTAVGRGLFTVEEVTIHKYGTNLNPENTFKVGENKDGVYLYNEIKGRLK